METETMVDVGRAVHALFDRPSAPTPQSGAYEAHAGNHSEEHMAWMQTLALPSEADPDV